MALLAGLSMAVATCAFGGTAQADQTPTVHRSPHPTAKPAPVRKGVKGVEAPSTWQIYNDTDKPIHIAYNFGYLGVNRSTTMEPGQSVYALGKSGLPGAHDLWADLRFADGSTVHIWEYNPSFNYPSVGFGDGSNWNRYYVNETFNKTENGHTFTVTRNPDPNVPWEKFGDHGYVKNFHIHITS